MNHASWQVGLSGEIPDAEIVSRSAGVGLIRGEYVLRQTGAYVTEADARAHLTGYLDRIAAAYAPKPVWYRFADFESQEIVTLRGCDGIEIDESPVLGARGVRRGILYPDTFALEADVVAGVAKHRDNLNVLVPYVRDAEDLRFAFEALDLAGFSNSRGTMLETPAALVLADDLLTQLCLDTCLIGLNDLTTLVLGAERRNRFHDKGHRAVWDLVRHALEVCHRHDISCGVAGDLDTSVARQAEAEGADYLVFHYHLIDRLVPGLSPVNDRDVVPALKARMATALARAQTAQP